MMIDECGLKLFRIVQDQRDVFFVVVSIRRITQTLEGLV